MKTLASSLVALLVWLVGAEPAQADDPPCAAEAAAVRAMKSRDPSLMSPTDPRALEHMEAAKRAYGVRDYETVIAHYTEAGKLDEAPLVIYDLGQTYRDAREYEKAIRQYKLFIQRGKPGREVEALVQCFIRQMTAELEQAASTAPPTGPDTEAPREGEEALPISSEGSWDDRGSSSSWTTTRKVAAGVGGTGAIVLGLGVAFAINVSGLKEDAAALCPNPTIACDRADEANALSDRASSRATVANIALGAGAAMVVGGVVMWFVGAPSGTTTPEKSAIVPHVSSSFAGLVITGRF